MSKPNTRAIIDANIRQNGQQLITGQVLNATLNAMVTDYAEQAALDGLKEKVDALALGAFYGYFPDSDSLPTDVTTPGYAYVGSDNPYEIWNFNGESWSDSGTSIDQNDADEEDITRNADGKLQFKDRSYGDGMGYVILRKDKTFAEQVTQANTIYEIRYDFDLDGEDVEIPSNCILGFNGGRIENGTLQGNQTGIISSREKIFDDTSIVGDWAISYVCPEWFGAKADGITDSSNAIQKCLDLGTVVSLGIGVYLCETKLLMKDKSVLRGCDKASSVLICNGIKPMRRNVISSLQISPIDKNTDILIDINSDYVSAANLNIFISDIYFYGVVDTDVNTTMIRLKCDSNHSVEGFHSVFIDKIISDNKFKKGIVFEAATNGTIRPWITAVSINNVFLYAVKTAFECISPDNLYHFEGIELFDFKSQYNADFTEYFIRLAGISRTSFSHCMMWDSPNKPYSLKDRNCKIVIRGDLGHYIDGLLYAEYDTSLDQDKLISEHLYGYSDTMETRGQAPLRGIGIDPSVNIPTNAPSVPLANPCFWADRSSSFYGMRLTDSTHFSASRRDYLIGFTGTGRPVCASRESGSGTFVLKEIYSDLYMPRTNAAGLADARSGRPLGAMIFDTTAVIPVWYDNNNGYWRNSLGTRIDANTTSVRGTTATRESMTLTSYHGGLIYYDETLRKYVYWNGYSWLNMDGTAL